MNKLNLKTKIEAIWSKLKARQDHDQSKVLDNPFRDWRRLFIVWFVFLLLILVGAAWLSWRINNLKVVLSPAEMAAQVTIKTSSVDKAKKYINERATRFEQNRQALPVSIDPGL